MKKIVIILLILASLDVVISYQNEVMDTEDITTTESVEERLIHDHYLLKQPNPSDEKFAAIPVKDAVASPSEVQPMTVKAPSETKLESVDHNSKKNVTSIPKVEENVPQTLSTSEVQPTTVKAQNDTSLPKVQGNGSQSSKGIPAASRIHSVPLYILSKLKQNAEYNNTKENSTTLVTGSLTNSNMTKNASKIAENTTQMHGNQNNASLQNSTNSITEFGKTNSSKNLELNSTKGVPKNETKISGERKATIQYLGNPNISQKFEVTDSKNNSAQISGTKTNSNVSNVIPKDSSLQNLISQKTEKNSTGLQSINKTLGNHGNVFEKSLKSEPKNITLEKSPANKNLITYNGITLDVSKVNSSKNSNQKKTESHNWFNSTTFFQNPFIQKHNTSFDLQKNHNLQKFSGSSKTFAISPTTDLGHNGASMDVPVKNKNTTFQKPELKPFSSNGSFLTPPLNELGYTGSTKSSGNNLQKPELKPFISNNTFLTPPPGNLKHDESAQGSARNSLQKPELKPFSSNGSFMQPPLFQKPSAKEPQMNDSNSNMKGSASKDYFLRTQALPLKSNGTFFQTPIIVADNRDNKQNSSKGQLQKSKTNGKITEGQKPGGLNISEIYIQKYWSPNSIQNSTIKERELNTAHSPSLQKNLQGNSTTIKGPPLGSSHNLSSQNHSQGNGTVAKQHQSNSLNPPSKNNSQGANSAQNVPLINKGGIQLNFLPPLYPSANFTSTTPKPLPKTLIIGTNNSTPKLVPVTQTGPIKKYGAGVVPNSNSGTLETNNQNGMVSTIVPKVTTPSSVMSPGPGKVTVRSTPQGYALVTPKPYQNNMNSSKPTMVKPLEVAITPKVLPSSTKNGTTPQPVGQASILKTTAKPLALQSMATTLNPNAQANSTHKTVGLLHGQATTLKPVPAKPIVSTNASMANGMSGNHTKPLIPNNLGSSTVGSTVKSNLESTAVKTPVLTAKPIVSTPATPKALPGSPKILSVNSTIQKSAHPVENKVETLTVKPIQAGPSSPSNAQHSTTKTIGPNSIVVTTSHPTTIKIIPSSSTIKAIVPNSLPTVLTTAPKPGPKIPPVVSEKPVGAKNINMVQNTPPVPEVTTIHPPGPGGSPKTISSTISSAPKPPDHSKDPKSLGNSIPITMAPPKGNIGPGGSPKTVQNTTIAPKLKPVIASTIQSTIAPPNQNHGLGGSPKTVTSTMVPPPKITPGVPPKPIQTTVVPPYVGPGGLPKTKTSTVKPKLDITYGAGLPEVPTIKPDKAPGFPIEQRPNVRNQVLPVESGPGKIVPNTLSTTTLKPNSPNTQSKQPNSSKPKEEVSLNSVPPTSTPKAPKVSPVIPKDPMAQVTTKPSALGTPKIPVPTGLPGLPKTGGSSTISNKKEPDSDSQTTEKLGTTKDGEVSQEISTTTPKGSSSSNNEVSTKVLPNLSSNTKKPIGLPKTTTKPDTDRQIEEELGITRDVEIFQETSAIPSPKDASSPKIMPNLLNSNPQKPNVDSPVNSAQGSRMGNQKSSTKIPENTSTPEDNSDSDNDLVVEQDIEVDKNKKDIIIEQDIEIVKDPKTKTPSKVGNKRGLSRLTIGLR